MPRLAEHVAAVAGEPLALSHQARIEALLGEGGGRFSELSFANLYLFRQVHDYRFVDGDAPHLLGTTYDGVRYAMPLGASLDLDEADADWLYPVAEADLPDGVTADWNDDDADYLYDAAALADLAGPRLKGHRQQARGYANRWAPEMTLGRPDFAASAAAVLDRWLEQVGKPAAATDDAACREAIALAPRLGLDCALVTGDGAPHAFLLAGRLPDGSKAVHFAKARRDLPGAYPFLFSCYAQIAGVETLNFEQDLGHPGFRRAKQALAPRERLRKYRVRLR